MRRLDRVLDRRRIALSLPATGERVPSHEQQAKHDDCEAEVVVIGAANRVRVAGQSLHFRRLVIACPHATQPSLIACGDLETVAIDALDGGIVRNQQVAVVHIADHHTRLMDEVKGPRGILRGVNQEAPVRLRKMLQSELWVIKIEDRPAFSADLWHHEPDETLAIEQDLSGPRTETAQRLIGDGQHGREFVERVASPGLVDLCYEVSAATDRVDRRFTAAADFRSEVDPLALAVGQCGH
jgi:hypothetical protein